MGLDGLLRARARGLHGILNGIDTGAWNPATDVHLPVDLFGDDARPAGGQPRGDRGALRAERGRLAAVLRRQPAHLAEGHGHARRRDRRAGRAGARLAVLGAGEAALEAKLSAAARHPGRVGVRRRLRRTAGASAAGRRRRDPRSVAVRALRADAVLRSALRLRAGGGAGRRPGRHDHRRQRRRAWRGRRDRHPVRTGRRRRSPAPSTSRSRFTPTRRRGGASSATA